MCYEGGMFFPKPMKKNNSIFHWEKQQKAKISQKGHCCIFGTCNNVLANEFFVLKWQHLQFGSSEATWFIFYRLPAVNIQPTPNFLELSQKENYHLEFMQRQGHIGMRNTVSPLYRSLLEDCAVHVLKFCFSFKPHCHSHLPHSSLWFPGVTGSFSSTRTQSLNLPTATSLGKPGISKEKTQPGATEALLSRECI